MGLHVEVHAGVRAGEVGHVAGVVHRLAGVVGLVHLDRVDVVVVVAVAAAGELERRGVVRRSLDAVLPLATHVAAGDEHRVDLVPRQRLAGEGGGALLGDGEDGGVGRAGTDEERGGDRDGCGERQDAARALLVQRARHCGLVQGILRTCRGACSRTKAIILL